jgi:hypothetical protein
MKEIAWNAPTAMPQLRVKHGCFCACDIKRCSDYCSSGILTLTCGTAAKAQQQHLKTPDAKGHLSQSVSWPAPALSCPAPYHRTEHHHCLRAPQHTKAPGVTQCVFAGSLFVGVTGTHTVNLSEGLVGVQHCANPAS